MRISIAIVARSIPVCICLALFMLTAGCGVHRDLRITEVGEDAIELYLDEPMGNSLDLTDHHLTVWVAGGDMGMLDLGAFGRSLNGGEFMVVWEDSGYSGSPVAQPYAGGASGSVPGIKVPNDFFHDMDDAVAAEILVRGDHWRGAVYDITNDCMRFGDSTARPRNGAGFDEDDSLPVPGGSAPLNRAWGGSGGGPRDTNHESDWLVLFGGSWGAATP